MHRTQNQHRSRFCHAPSPVHACMLFPAAASAPTPCASTQYSFSLTTFSPSGKLVQIEYALNAVAAGATSLGISATDGVVIATEKKLPSILVDESTVQKICMLTPNIGVVYSGMGPDYRVLVRKARKTAQAYHRLYNEHIPVAQLVRETAAVMQEFTREWCHRVVWWVGAVGCQLGVLRQGLLGKQSMHSACPQQQCSCRCAGRVPQLVHSVALFARLC